MNLFDWAAAHHPEGTPSNAAMESCQVAEAAAHAALPCLGREAAIAAPEIPTEAGANKCRQAPPATFREALSLLRAGGRIPEENLRRWASDVRRAAKIMGMTPEQLPLEPRQLVPLLEAIRHGGRLNPRTWANLRSQLASIAKAIGIHARKPRFPPPLGKDWAQLIEPRLDQFQRLSLLGFIRWCDGLGLGPNDVTEATLSDYGRWRSSNTYICRPYAVLRQVRTTWNGAVKHVTGWPQRRIGPPDRRVKEGTPLQPAALPQTFQDDLVAYLDGMSTVRPFEGRKRALSEVTIRNYRRHLLMAATFCAAEFGGPQNVVGLGCLASAEALRAALARRFEIDGGKWSAQAKHMAVAIIGVAQHHLKFEAESLEPLQELQRWVTVGRGGRLTAKARDRLAQFDDAQLRKSLYTLASKLSDEAEKIRTKKPAAAAIQHRHGILLYILLRCALRRRNLIRLHLQQDFVRNGQGQVVGIHIKSAGSGNANITKNGNPYRAVFKVDFARLFDRHVRVFRPLLPGASGPWLVPDRSGGRHGSVVNQATRLAQVVQEA
jgi:hypothetical protein